MQTVRKLSGLLLLGMITGVVAAQNVDCIVRKTFHAREGTYLRIINKFGDININNVKNDSISVCATITIIQDDKELLQKSVSLVKTDIEKSNDTIDVRTVFDEKFFSAAYRKGRTRFSVDYIINAPRSTNLFIQNEFGDIIIDEITGIVNIRLAKGDFSASKLSRGNLKPVSSLQIELGKITIDEINWISLTVRHCQSVKIGKAKALLLTSEFSKLNIGELSSLVCDSKSDSYDITAIKNLIAKGFYTVFQIGELSGQLQAGTTFGRVSVSKLLSSFTTVDLISNRTLIDIITQKGISYRTNIMTTNTLLDFPINKLVVSRSNDNKTTTVSGLVGNNSETKSLMKIKADFGTLKIE